MQLASATTLVLTFLFPPVHPPAVFVFLYADRFPQSNRESSWEEERAVEVLPLEQLKARPDMTVPRPFVGLLLFLRWGEQRVDGNFNDPIDDPS